MKLKKFAKIINEVCENHPKVEVVLNSGMGEDGHVDRITNIEVKQAKPHEDTHLFLKGHLKNGGWGGGDAFIQPYQKKIEAEKDIWVIHIT